MKNLSEKTTVQILENESMIMIKGGDDGNKGVYIDPIGEHGENGG